MTSEKSDCKIKIAIWQDHKQHKAYYDLAFDVTENKITANQGEICKRSLKFEFNLAEMFR